MDIKPVFMNADCKLGWPTKYYPNFAYKINNDELVLEGNSNNMDYSALMKALIERTLIGNNQIGGTSRELAKFRLSSKDIKGGFAKLEKKVDNYLRKNNLEIKNDIILSLESLDDKKIFFKKYRKKNL